MLTFEFNFLKFHKILFRCECFKGLRGSRCDEVDNPCNPNPCHNYADCRPKLLRDPNNVTTETNDEIFKEFSCR